MDFARQRRPQRPAAKSTRPRPAQAQGRLIELQRNAGNAATTSLVTQLRDEVQGVQRQVAEPAVSSGRRTLRRGSTGEDVKVLQMKLRWIRERAHDRDVNRRARIDGIFGPLTHADVVDFQNDAGLDPDGIVGPKTWDALDSIVPETPVEAIEIQADETFDQAIALKQAGQYDAALALFEGLVQVAATPEMAGVAFINVGVCHQQRGRFGLAVQAYEQALRGRFGQEELRAETLGKLIRARQGLFLDRPAPDPEPVPPGGEPAGPPGVREGGGVTPRDPVKLGDTGPSVDLYKGKLAHLMVGWPPSLPPGASFDPPTAERTRAFQKACGLDETGDASSSTWHAIDSFTKADVPFSVVSPIFDRARAAHDLSRTDPRAGLTALESTRDEARGLGLVEVVKNEEALIGRAHHQLGEFEEAIAHYTLYLERNIPNPDHYGFTLEHLRRARGHEPPVA